jgi:hypothetical protein
MIRQEDNRNLSYFNKTVLICSQCGKYSTIVDEKTQFCSCNTLLKYEGRISESAKEVNNCKICSLIAHQNT